MIDFQYMLDKQLELQINAYNVHPARLPRSEQVAFIRDMTLACTDELHEALNEVGWKPWATSHHVNRDAFISELVDAFHFFMNLMLVVDCGVNEFMNKYYVKHKKNMERQEDGYDGVSEKCPVCNRALDDDAVRCTIGKDVNERVYVTCCANEHD